MPQYHRPRVFILLARVNPDKPAGKQMPPMALDHHLQ
jgi:hypothetical protein